MKYLEKLEGLNTLESAAEKLGVKKTTALNILCKLKKACYVKTTGGKHQPRFYKVTLTKQLPRYPGMYDILNKHSKHMKLNEAHDHQVHGLYAVEDALVDAVQAGSFRVLLSSMQLFNHITNWKNLYHAAKKAQVWQKIGALYDVARAHMRVKRMPKRYRKGHFPEKAEFFPLDETKEDKYEAIAKQWNIEIPFRRGDIAKLGT